MPKFVSDNFWRIVFLLILRLCAPSQLQSQAKNDSLTLNIKTWQLLSIEGIAYTGSMLALNEVWYKHYQRTSFHWYNDNDEWLQMDKAGHGYAAYQLALQNAWLLEQSGMRKQQAAWVSSGIAFFAMSGIELFDGYSSGWGASTGDLMANLGGTGVYVIQEYLWSDQLCRLKYSYRTSGYAAQRPGLLGKNITQSMLKDYNAQTYWLSFNLYKTTGIEQIPPWLAIAFGYGANGMISGNPNDASNHFNRYRQFYLSPDIDWQQIPARRKCFRVLFRILNMVKVPFPAVAYQKGSFGWVWVP